MATPESATPAIPKGILVDRAHAVGSNDAEGHRRYGILLHGRQGWLTTPLPKCGAAAAYRLKIFRVLEHTKTETDLTHIEVTGQELGEVVALPPGRISTLEKDGVFARSPTKKFNLAENVQHLVNHERNLTTR